MRHRTALRLQRIFSFLFLPLVYFLFSFYFLFIRRYKIRDKREIRRQFRKRLKENKDPILICANHLTFFDAFGIIWALSSIWGYLIHFYRFPWNIPSQKVASTSLPRRFVSYIGKMMPIETKGEQANAKQVLEKIITLLEQGDTAMLFPEGTRSTTGRLNREDYGYGAGQILQAVPQTKVLVVYFRGEEEKNCRDLPKKGCRFYMKLKWLVPKTTQSGRQAIRSLSNDIMEALWQMEEDYFKSETLKVLTEAGVLKNF